MFEASLNFSTVRFKVCHFLCNLVTFFVISMPLGVFGGEAPTCSTVKNQAEFLVSQLNNMFGKSTQIIWNIENQSSAPSPFDARFDEQGNIRIPDLCSIENKLPSPQLISFIVLHEYSHSLLDTNTKVQNRCGRALFNELNIDLDNDYEKHSKKISRLAQLEHENRDILALKLMSHFKIDSLLALTDLAGYPQKNAIRKKLWENRSEKLRGLLPTNFSHGEDINTTGVFQGIENLKKFLGKSYPSSSLIGDVSKNIVITGEGCSIFSKDSIENLLKSSQINQITNENSVAQ